MTILPLDPAANATPDALRGFLGQCRTVAARAGRAQLVSISLEVGALDPLAVLESIFEPGELHFYVERPAEHLAVAGAEAVLSFTAMGADRFAACQRFIDETLAATIAVGDQRAPFAGPHFFTAFTFLPEVEAGESFPAAQVFVPRWQVGQRDGRTVAVANLVVTPDALIEALAERVWRAHAKFTRFEYGEKCDTGRPNSGTGLPPMGLNSGSHGQDARATKEQNHGRDARATTNAPAFTAGTLQIRQGAYLPHWTRDGAIYAVTFRLADSLPASVLEAWRNERSAIEARARQQDSPLSAYERERLLRLHSEKLEGYLDAGAGACYLRQPEVAKLVTDALRHFDGERYELHEWCVMPNHVHAILRPLGRHRLEEILHSWKSFTANQANRLLGLAGEFWQPEYYDHLIRDEAEYAHAIEYLRQNPVKAGLTDWRWIGGVDDSGFRSGTGILPVGLLPNTAAKAHGQDARATNSDEAHYCAAVQRALDLIAAGHLEKIVLARAKELRAPEPFHPLRALNGLRERYADCFAFSVANGRGQSFIGASPERLLRVREGRLTTEALAGSVRRGASASEDTALGGALLCDEKELREHRLVIASIARRLAPLGIRPEHPDRPALFRLANVQHLHTPVQAALPAGVRLLDVLANLHPTPAVGGTPREAALPHIRALEGFPRGLYAGALGWIDAHGGGEFFVGLRSALIDGANARLYAGAGIVAGSSPGREFAETELKFRAMQETLLD